MRSFPWLLAMLLAVFVFGCKRAPTPGEACKTEGEAECSKDNTIMFSCAKGKWDQAVCRGPKACQVLGTTVMCDETVANAGDPCGTPDGDHFSCSLDGKSQLQCVGGAWKVVSQCGGPEGCKANTAVVKCDDSVASVGDLCNDENDAACSVDSKAILECKGGKFAEAERCKTGACKVTGLRVACE